MKKEEFETLKIDELLDNYKRAIELRVQNGGNGKSPFDEKQLEEEIARRLGKSPIVYTVEENKEGELWAGHQ